VEGAYPLAAGGLRQPSSLNWRRLEEARGAPLRSSSAKSRNPVNAGEELAKTTWRVMETTFSGLSVGMKIYDNDWFLTHQLEPEQAVDVLKAMGVTWLIAQSRFLPMADSAVDSAVRKSDRERYASLDDVAFRRALKDRGIAYFAVLNICFDPAFAARHPELLPVDQFGRRAETQDWYIGLNLPIGRRTSDTRSVCSNAL
jgi:hypothetical protein